MLLAEKLSRTNTRASNFVRKNVFIVVAGILTAMMFQFLLCAIDIPAEAALAFQCGRLIADGKTPYIDFFEVSSPALMYLNAIPALFSKFLPFLHPIVVFHFFLLILIAASCFLSAQILFRVRFREQAHAPFFIIGFAMLNLLMIGEAGQREHLFLLLYIPFFLCRWMTWTNHKVSERLSLIAGISGGIAACLDPLCLFSVIAMELFFLATKLKVSPFRSRELAAAGTVVAVFFLHFVLFPPDYRQLYFSWALPLVFCDYSMWDQRLSWAHKTPDLRKLLYVLIFIIVFSLGLRRWCSLIAPCVGLSILGLGLFIIQGKSMTYQALPMVYGAGLAAFLVLSVFFNGLIKWKDLQLPLLRSSAVIAMVMAGLVASIGFKLYCVRDARGIDLSTVGYSGFAFIDEKLPSPAVTTYTIVLQRDTKVNDEVMILNDRVRPGYPLLLQYSRKPAGYLLTGFPMRLSKTLIDTNPDKAAEYRGQQFKMYSRLIEDVKKKPTIIMIEKTLDGLGEVLNEHQLMETIDKYYEGSCMAEWPDVDSDQAFDYYAFRCALDVYKLRPPGSESTPAADASPQPVPAPATPTTSDPTQPRSPVQAPPVVPTAPVVSPAQPQPSAPNIPPTAPVQPQAPSTPPAASVKPPVASPAPPSASSPIFNPFSQKPEVSEDKIDPVTGLPFGAPIEPVAPPSPKSP